MTSPDMAAPPGTYPAQLLNTLQEIQACGIGKEGKLLIQALAAFGDGITKEFYHGFTNVVDAVQAGFDALGEALSGEPGMGGILGFANDIQGTVLGAIELSEVLLGDVTEILKQLALGLGCNDTAGPIAENIGQSLRDALAKLTMVMRMLFTLIEVITGIPGASMEDLAAFLQGKWDAIGAVSALAQRIRDVIFEAFGFIPTGDDENDLLGALQAIPQGNISGLTDALANVNEYIQNLVNAILQAVRGIPVVGGTLEDIIADIGDLQQTAVDAQTDAAAAQSTAVGVQGTVQTRAITTGVQDGMTFSKVAWSSNGTWTVPTAEPGMKIVAFDLICIGGGDSGGRPGTYCEGGLPGLGGGYIRRRFLPEEITGSSYAVTIGAGAGTQTSRGPGTTGGVTSIGSLLSSPKSGESAIVTAFGRFRSDAAPGAGGKGGDMWRNGDNALPQNGYPGENSLGALGGQAGRSGSGWFGGSATPTSGGTVTQPADDLYGGAGGGGGGAEVWASGDGQDGAPGSAPGGGGGGGGAGTTTGTGNGAAGAPGGAAVITWQAPL